MHLLFGWSITLGVHRYFSHHSFVAPNWLHTLLAVAYTLSFERCGQGVPSWAAANNGAAWYRWDADSVIMKILEQNGVIHGCRWLTEADLEHRRLRPARVRGPRLEQASG